MIEEVLDDRQIKKGEIMDLKDIDTIEIIRGLREFAPNLPDSGFVAGGAVAAKINHIVRGVDSPIRDVDLFQHAESTDNDSQRFVPTNAEARYFRRLEDTGYTVIKAEREDKLNIVHCIASIEGFESNILKGFDINCCQAGISLSTGELFYTPDFIDFLKSGNVYITNVGNPYHSAVRLFKKTKDMLGNCNFREELAILSLAIRLLKPGYTSEEIPLDDLSFLDKEDKDILSTFYTIEENTPLLTMSVNNYINYYSDNYLGLATCATQFMAKIKALRKNPRDISLFLLDEPIAYQIPDYLDNYRDVTLGDIENRRDNEIAVRMEWNIRQHCEYSRHTQFTNLINDNIDSTIRQVTDRLIEDAQQPKDEANPDLNQNRTSSPDNSRQPIATGPWGITAEEILIMLSSASPIEDRSLLNQLRNNNLFGISLQSAINSCIIEHFAKK
jgi:hypothetical protein